MKVSFCKDKKIFGFYGDAIVFGVGTFFDIVYSPTSLNAVHACSDLWKVKQ